MTRASPHSDVARPAFVWPGTAAETAAHVIRWAARQAPGQPSAAPADPPRGSLRSVQALATSQVAIRELRELTRATAARLGAGTPILGDASSLSLGGVLLAAAIGGREQADRAVRLAALLPPPPLAERDAGGWADALARHAVVAPALRGLDRQPATVARSGSGPATAVGTADSLVVALRDASPLTAVLRHPGSNADQRAVATARALLSRPHGRAVLVSALSWPDPDAEVLRWRARLLQRLVATHAEDVLEIYSAARLLHGEAWDHAVQTAVQSLAMVVDAGVDPQAVATVQYWAALRDRNLVQSVRNTLWRDDVRHLLVLLDRHPLAKVSAT